MTTNADRGASAQNPASLNRYLYAEANPATLVDPDGHCTKNNPECSSYFAPGEVVKDNAVHAEAQAQQAAAEAIADRRSIATMQRQTVTKAALLRQAAEWSGADASKTAQQGGCANAYIYDLTGGICHALGYDRNSDPLGYNPPPPPPNLAPLLLIPAAYVPGAAVACVEFCPGVVAITEAAGAALRKLTDKPGVQNSAEVGAERVAAVIRAVGGAPGPRIKTIFGSTDIDVVGALGQIIEVGGPSKDPGRLGMQLQRLTEYSAATGQGPVQFWFAPGTPQATLNVAVRWLGSENVIPIPH